MRTLNALLLAATLAPAQHSVEPSFEEASIRAHRGNDIRSGSLSITSPLIRLTGYTMYGLLLDAFDLNAYQISWPPHPPVSVEDVAGTMYDIVARAPGDAVPPADVVRRMLRNLLSDRFKLSVHFETKMTDVYILRSGSKHPALATGDPGQPCSVHSSLAADGRNEEQVFANCSSSQLAEALDKIEGRPVLDQTGLQGVYNFRYIAVPDYRARDHSEAVDIDRIEAVNRLGLKLASEKAALPILFIDHLETPTPN